MQLNDISPEQIKKAIRTFANIGTLREAKGITHEEMEAVYSVGLSYYKTGRFEQAEKLFRFLCLFDHVNSKFWTALGGVYQATRRLEEAEQAYMFAIFLDCRNYRAYCYLIQCQRSRKEEESALEALLLFESACEKVAEARPYLEKMQTFCADLKEKYPEQED